MARSLEMFLVLLITVSLVQSISSFNPEIQASVQCGTRQFWRGNSFAKNVEVVLRDLILNTGAHANKEYKNISPSPSSFVYGYGKCRPELSPHECKACLENLSSSLDGRCGSAAAGRATSFNCLLRYEDHPFHADDFKFNPGESFSSSSSSAALALQ